VQPGVEEDHRGKVSRLLRRLLNCNFMTSEVTPCWLITTRAFGQKNRVLKKQLYVFTRLDRSCLSLPQKKLV